MLRPPLAPARRTASSIQSGFRNTCSAGGGGSARGPGETPHFNRLVSPGQRDERRHGQTHFVLGRDGVAAGLSFRSRHDTTRQRRGKLPHGSCVTFLGLSCAMIGLSSWLFGQIYRLRSCESNNRQPVLDQTSLMPKSHKVDSKCRSHFWLHPP